METALEGRGEGYVKGVEGEKRKENSGTCVSGINFPHAKLYARAAVCSVQLSQREEIFVYVARWKKT